eukprot:215486_1
MIGNQLKRFNHAKENEKVNKTIIKKQQGEFSLKWLLLNILLIVAYICVLKDYTSYTKTELLYTNTQTFNKNDLLNSKSIIIVGMIKNSERSIRSMLRSLDIIACNYYRSVIMIYESHSTDSTPEILKQWSLKNYSYNCSNKLHQKFLLKPLIDPAYGANIQTREDKYVIYRNYLLNQSILINQKLSQDSNENTFTGFDYYTIFDDVMSINHSSIIQEMTHISKTENPFHIICVNGQKNHMIWDTFAAIFMDDVWAFVDPFINHRSAFNERQFLVNKIINKNKFTPMKSCFGGMAFYKNFNRLIESKCKYMSYDVALKTYPVFNNYLWNRRKNKKYRQELCEHFAFHLCLGANGFKLAINRDMLLYYD